MKNNIQLYISYLISFGLITLTGNQCLAKDLYVSLEGSDAVSYEANSLDTPWKTIMHGVFNVKAGDTLHIRGGTYRPEYTMYLRNDYANKNYGGNPAETMNAESGTSINPVVITQYKKERVIIDLDAIKQFAAIDNKDYWTFKNLTFINTGIAFILGENVKAHHITFDGLKLYAKYYSDNSAPIKINSDLAEYTTIKNCVIKGATSDDGVWTVSGIFARRVRNLTITNNVITTGTQGIYYKHSTIKQSDTAAPLSITISNNYLDDFHYAAMNLNTIGAVINNNIIGPTGGSIKVNEASGSPGGDLNTFDHNTLINGTIILKAETQREDNSTPGANKNIITNNVLTHKMKIHEYQSTWGVADHETTSNYNLFANNGAVSENGVDHSLPSWQQTSGEDANSLQATPLHKEGASPSFFIEYSLGATSIGYRSAQDGSDIGANSSTVGPVGYFNSPKAPIVGTQ